MPGLLPAAHGEPNPARFQAPSIIIIIILIIIIIIISHRAPLRPVCSVSCQVFSYLSFFRYVSPPLFFSLPPFFLPSFHIFSLSTVTVIYTVLHTVDRGAGVRFDGGVFPDPRSRLRHSLPVVRHTRSSPRAGAKGKNMAEGRFSFTYFIHSIRFGQVLQKDLFALLSFPSVYIPQRVCMYVCMYLFVCWSPSFAWRLLLHVNKGLERGCLFACRAAFKLT